MAATLIFRVAVWQCGKREKSATLPHYICHTLECGTVAVWHCRIVAGIVRSTATDLVINLA